VPYTVHAIDVKTFQKKFFNVKKRTKGGKNKTKLKTLYKKRWS